MITSKLAQAKYAIAQFMGKVTEKSENSAYRILINFQSINYKSIDQISGRIDAKALRNFQMPTFKKHFPQYPPSCGRLLKLFFCHILWSQFQTCDKKNRRMSILSSGIVDVSKPFVGQEEEFDVCLV